MTNPTPHGQVPEALLRAARAPADSVPAGGVVAYLDIGAGGYLDLGSDLSNEAISRLPKGRHALIIAGTYGIDGYTPTPPAQVADNVLADGAEPAGAVYAELPMQFACSGVFPVYSADQMRAFADATHTLRAESLAAAQTISAEPAATQPAPQQEVPDNHHRCRLLTRAELDALGAKAEGMDGNQWEMWVQEQFARANRLKIEGSNYD